MVRVVRVHVPTDLHGLQFALKICHGLGVFYCLCPNAILEVVFAALEPFDFRRALTVLLS